MTAFTGVEPRAQNAGLAGVPMAATPPMTADTREPAAAGSLASLTIRGAIGGALMGLANLVPGISGGTMLLAAGVYPAFIAAIADVTTFRFARRTLVAARPPSAARRGWRSCSSRDPCAAS